MFNSNQDLYDWVLAKSSELEKKGYSEWALTLKKSVTDGGATTGEVFDRIQFFLRKLKATTILREFGLIPEVNRALNRYRSRL